MFKFIKQAFIVFLGFSGSLAKIHIFIFIYINNELCLARPTLIALNPNERHCSLFVVSLVIHQLEILLMYKV